MYLDSYANFKAIRLYLKVSTKAICNRKGKSNVNIRMQEYFSQ